MKIDNLKSKPVVGVLVALGAGIAAFVAERASQAEAKRIDDLENKIFEYEDRFAKLEKREEA